MLRAWSCELSVVHKSKVILSYFSKESAFVFVFMLRYCSGKLNSKETKKQRRMRI